MLLEAVGTDWNNHAVSSEDVDAIALRWRQMGYLRDLYLDDVLSKEFDLFRARFVVDLPEADRKVIVQPGLVASSTSSSRLQCSRQYTHGFKAGFYQSLCLHSMAIATRQLAKIAPDISEELTRHPFESFILNIYDLWIKQSVVLGGINVLLDWDVKLYCLEVFDFLYMFLLRKIFPFEMLDAWKREDADVYPYDRDGFTADPSRTDEWYSLLEQSRWVLKPHDIFELIKHQAWRADAAFPQSKSMYMRVRGMFDLTHEGDLDFHSFHNRSQMVEEICTQWAADPAEPEEPCCWDHMRVEHGSPFLPGGPFKYQLEMVYTEMCVQTANSREPAVPLDTNAAETAEHPEHTELSGQETSELGDGDTGESAGFDALEHAAEY